MWVSGISLRVAPPYGRITRTDDKGSQIMQGRTLSVKIAVGVGLALAGAVPIADAKAPRVDRPAVSFYTPQALNALDRRWNAEAASFGPARALKALDGRWNAEARRFGR